MKTSDYSSASYFTHIQPKKGWLFIDFKEIWDYRDLFFFLVSRDIKVKYKQTVLGALWAVLQPFFSMVVFTIFFGKLAKMPSDGIPYPIFNYTAMVGWTYFSTAITNSGNSLVTNTNLITKVYFPRLVVPIAPTIAGLLDFVIALSLLLAMMFYYKIYPTVYLILIPLLVIMMMMCSGGVGMLLAALNTKYRDIKYTIPFLTQLWMFASPIVYPSSLVPEKYRLIYALNPMVGIIEGFRSALLGKTVFPVKLLAVSAAVSFLIFLAGAFYFKQTERYFADTI